MIIETRTWQNAGGTHLSLRKDASGTFIISGPLVFQKYENEETARAEWERVSNEMNTVMGEEYQTTKKENNHG